MVSRRTNGPEPTGSRRPPATTPEGRENQLINLAVEVAERQLREGTASAQVITHYLKLGSSRERLEQERLRGEVGLTRIKQEVMESQKAVEALYGEALAAMRSYSGQPPLESEGDYDDPDIF